MEYLESLPVTVLDRYPKVDEARVDADLAEALAGLGRKIVVLDDDPTGVQTVHHVPVYTDWRPQTLLEAFSEDCPRFHRGGDRGGSPGAGQPDRGRRRANRPGLYRH